VDAQRGAHRLAVQPGHALEQLLVDTDFQRQALAERGKLLLELLEQCARGRGCWLGCWLCRHGGGLRGDVSGRVSGLSCGDFQGLGGGAVGIH
jgi:hypothetical protein